MGLYLNCQSCQGVVVVIYLGEDRVLFSQNDGDHVSRFAIYQPFFRPICILCPLHKLPQRICIKAHLQPFFIRKSHSKAFWNEVYLHSLIIVKVDRLKVRSIFVSSQVRQTKLFVPPGCIGECLLSEKLNLAKFMSCKTNGLKVYQP